MSTAWLWTGLTTVGLLLWTAMLTWSCAAAIIAHFKFRHRRKAMAPRADRSSVTEWNDKNAIAVTILRPLKGIDVNLEANLEANFKMEYPQDRFEIILSVAESDDPAVAVARRVIKRNPKVDATLILGQDAINVNPKINNMVRGYRQAKHDFIWIVDSNVCVERDTMQAASNALQDSRVGLVHHTPEGVDALSIGARLEQLFLNTAHAKIYLVINAIGTDSCVMGKSMMFRKSDLERCGGLESFGRYMAEDNLIGIAIMNLGRLHRLSTKTAKQPLSSITVRDYVLRRSRWTRIRAYTMPFVTLIEPFTECLISGVTGSLSLYALADIPLLLTFTFHVAFWFACDVFLVMGLSQSTIPNLLTFTLFWFLRELSALPIYIYSVFGSNKVIWRGRQYVMQLGGTVAPLDPSVNYTNLHWLQGLFFRPKKIDVQSPLTSPMPKEKKTTTAPSSPRKRGRNVHADV